MRKGHSLFYDWENLSGANLKAALGRQGAVTRLDDICFEDLRKHRLSDFADFGVFPNGLGERTTVAANSNLTVLRCCCCRTAKRFDRSNSPIDPLIHICIYRILVFFADSEANVANSFNKHGWRQNAAKGR